MRWLLIAVLVAACSSKAPHPELTIVGESTRLRMEGPRPARTAWFDGERVSLVAARGETLGLQVIARDAQPTSLALGVEGVTVSAFEVDSFVVKTPSTAMYGGSQGRGTYPDALRPVADIAKTTPAYFEVVVRAEAQPGTYAGELVAGARRVPVQLEILPLTLPPLGVGVWAYGDPRELVWADNPTGDPPRAEPSPTELACIGMFRQHGVLLSPDIHPEWWAARKHLLREVRDVPVWIPRDMAGAVEATQFWVRELAGTGQVGFTIPVDEPRNTEKQQQVRMLAGAVRAAGGGPTTLRYTVTDDIRTDRYGDLVDLYISLYAKRADRVPRWTYNGAPPHAGSFLLDGASPGARTWGWIAWRWNIGLWYVWDALYWHDRHNRPRVNGTRAPLPGKPLDVNVDPISFDDGTDRGNLDGVLAFPVPGGCQRTLRLAAIRRGMQDKQLLELASACDRTATEELAARMVPRALGDAPKGSRQSWPNDESVWENARRELLHLASCQRAAQR
jgi:hypothetical protein